REEFPVEVRGVLEVGIAEPVEPTGDAVVVGREDLEGRGGIDETHGPRTLGSPDTLRRLAPGAGLGVKTVDEIPEVRPDLGQLVNAGRDRVGGDRQLEVPPTETLGRADVVAPVAAAEHLAREAQ